MASEKKYKRVKKTFECPNPLFDKWLKEWYDEAVERKWKSQYNYKKAIQSLNKYPLPLKSGKEARVLDHFGDKICQMLDDKLKEYVKKHESFEMNLSEESSDESVEMEKMEKNRKIQSKIIKKRCRDYVPVRRSGGYAILVALFRNELNGSDDFMKKLDLMDAAQQYSEKSFKLPEPGSYYTAWSSMSILIRKGLVKKQNSPAKYYLTETGRELATKLMEAENKMADSNPSSQLTSSTSPPFSSQSSNDKLPTTGTGSSSTQQKFVYCYVSENGEEIREKDKAMIKIEHEMIFFLVKCEKENLLSCGRCFKVDTTRAAVEDFVYAFLHDNHADHVIPEDQFLDSNPNSQTNVSPSYRSTTRFTLSPGQYEIVLCVDNCETATGESKSRKLLIQKELKENGVVFDIRKLNVGDYTWIAREKVNLVPGQLRLPKSRELVLDYIVERKRIDDLASSIKDGRFREQKFRLKECGLRHPIYLVEEIASQTSLPDPTLRQAINNTQIIDGFIIKQTKNLTDSVTFLTLMTRYLQSQYSNQILTSCAKESISTSEKWQNKLMTFEEFNNSSVKSGDTTIRDMFVKQLLQLGGISVDKAAAIIDKYPTPANLIRAYKQCDSEKEKENLMANLKYGLSKRNIGPSLSRIFYKFFNKDSFI